ncbi:MAG: SH3 domain-containing protein [Planctomycetota bacterium]
MSKFFVCCVGFFLVNTSVAVAAAAESFPANGMIKGANVNVRTGPSQNHWVITSLIGETEVVVAAQESDWFVIYLPPYSTCWIHSDYVLALGDGAGESLRVNGSNVNLRATPATTHEVIGKVAKDVVLRATGRRSPDQKWIEIFAPAEARGYVHKNYLITTGSLGLTDVPSRLAQLRPAKPAVEERPEPGVAEPDRQPKPAPSGAREAPDDAMSLPAIPTRVAGGFLSPRLKQFLDRWNEERKKPALEWQLERLASELEVIRMESEDTGEAKLAKAWTEYFRDRLVPIQAGLKDLERARELAREKEQSGEVKPKELGKVVLRDPPDASEFLAKGWVFTMSKNRKIEGTHRLMKGNNLLYYLVSEHIDLNKYVYKRIGIQGVLVDLPADAGARLIRVTSVEVLSD